MLDLPIDDLLAGQHATRFGDWNLYPTLTGRVTSPLSAHDMRVFLGLPAAPIEWDDIKHAKTPGRIQDILEYVEPDVVMFLTKLIDALVVRDLPGQFVTRIVLTPLAYDDVRTVPDEANIQSVRSARRRSLTEGFAFDPETGSFRGRLLDVPLPRGPAPSAGPDQSILTANRRRSMLARCINDVGPKNILPGRKTLISPADYLVYAVGHTLAGLILLPEKHALNPENVYAPERPPFGGPGAPKHRLYRAYLRREIASLPQEPAYHGEAFLPGIHLGDVMYALERMLGSQSGRRATIESFENDPSGCGGRPEAIAETLKSNVLLTLFDRHDTGNLRWWETMLAAAVLDGSEAALRVHSRVWPWKPEFRPVLSEIFAVFQDAIPPLVRARQTASPSLSFERVFQHAFACACVDHARNLVGGPAAELVAMAAMVRGSASGLA